MRVLVRRVINADPVAFTFAFAIWCFSVGASLIAPGSVFLMSPAWGVLSSIHASETDWGWYMVANGLLLLAAIRMEIIPYRAGITLVSAVTWGVLGVSLLVAGWTKGQYISVVGAYSVWCSAQALLAVEQWVRHASRGSQPWS